MKNLITFVVFMLASTFFTSVNAYTIIDRTKERVETHDNIIQSTYQLKEMHEILTRKCGQNETSFDKMWGWGNECLTKKSINAEFGKGTMYYDLFWNYTSEYSAVIAIVETDKMKPYLVIEAPNNFAVNSENKISMTYNGKVFEICENCKLKLSMKNTAEIFVEIDVELKNEIRKAIEFDEIIFEITDKNGNSKKIIENKIYEFKNILKIIDNGMRKSKNERKQTAFNAAPKMPDTINTCYGNNQISVGNNICINRFQIEMSNDVRFLHPSINERDDIFSNRYVLTPYVEITNGRKITGVLTTAPWSANRDYNSHDGKKNIYVFYDDLKIPVKLTRCLFQDGNLNSLGFCDLDENAKNHLRKMGSSENVQFQVRTPERNLETTRMSKKQIKAIREMMIVIDRYLDELQ